MGQGSQPGGTGALLRAMVRDVPAAIVVTDVTGRVALANRAGRRLLGRPGRVSLVEGVHAQDAERLTSYLDAVASSASHRAVHLSDLAVRWGDVDRVVAVDARLLRGVPGFRGLVVSLQDVSQFAEELRGLRRSAYEDALTGLPNRAAMWNALQQSFRAQQRGSVLMVDLDGFKGINDTYGHQAGDRVLVTVAQRLQAVVGTAGVVGRVGGDEFVVLLHAGGSDEARRVMTSIELVLERPVAIGQVDVVVSAGIGAAALEHSPDAALHRADEAMYRAKSLGRAQVRVWTDDDEEWRVRRADVSAELETLRRRLSELHAESRTDYMTGLPNTRRLFEDLDALGSDDGLATAGLVFIDLDHFGAVNRARGDGAGDDVLRRVGEVFRSACRDGDTVYRKGGEEFVVLLPGAGLEQAERVAHRFRRRLLEARIPHLGRDDMPVVTLSAGVASSGLGSEDAVDALMRSAAMRMLRAKQSGRNRVVSADDQA